MSTKAILFVLLAVLAIFVSANVQCFYGTSYTTGNVEYRNTQPEPCGGQFCMKIYQKNYHSNNYQTNSYGCNNGYCTSSGCSENSNGYGTCCCRGNYCNSGFDLSKTVSSIVLTVVSVVYMYI